jgi:hypothetical protein
MIYMAFIYIHFGVILAIYGHFAHIFIDSHGI